ncbi:MAG: type II toxin-antitoxin system HicA family toxin [Thermotogota bacterium]
MTRAPQITARELLAFLKRKGFVEERRSGSHLTLRHPNSGKTVTLPVHTGCDLGRGPAVRVLRDAGFSLDDYLAAR